MVGKFENIEIKGIVTVVPSEVEDNSRYVEILGKKRVKKQTRMTGVKERHIDDGRHEASDYCISAAKELLNRLDWDTDKIKVMVFVTQNPSIIMPSTAFVIHKYLDLPKDCMVFDVNLGCSGYVSGLHIVSSLLQQYEVGTRGLLLVGDTQRSPHYVQPESLDEIADQMLFGTCGTATALEITESADSIFFEEKAEGTRYKALCMKYGEATHMDGEAVFEFAIGDVSDWVSSFGKEVYDIEKKEIDYYIFHQAQEFLLKNIAMICDIDTDKMLMSMQNYGNTSSGSIPLTICLHKDEILQKESRLFLCGFGVGLSCSMMQFTVQPDILLELVESDEMYSY